MRRATQVSGLIRRTTQWIIPPHRQPPFYLLAAVVLFSLAPLGWHVAEAAEPLQARAQLPSSLPAILSIEAAPLAAIEIAAPAPEPVEVLSADEEADPQEQEVIIVVDDDAAMSPAPRRRSAARASTRPARRSIRRPPSKLGKATSACKRKNKEAARDAYRQIPRGDARRREIRKACRAQGIWIL